MNRKTIILLTVVLTVIFTFLLSFYGSNPYNSSPTLAKYMYFSSEELTFDSTDDSKIYYYLPYLEEGEDKVVDLKDFIVLDEEATNQETNVTFTIIYDNPEDASKLSLVSSGLLAGRLTITGQTSATIVASTTDGSSISAMLFIRPTKYIPSEEHSGDIFK